MIHRALVDQKSRFAGNIRGWTSSFTLALICSILFGCAAPPENHYPFLQHGMTRRQVFHVLGRPESVTRLGAVEILNYRFPHKLPNGLYPGGFTRRAVYVVMNADQRVQTWGADTRH